MDANEVIGEIQKDLQLVKEKQQKIVSIEALENYLEKLKKYVGASETEWMAAHQANLEHYKAQNEAKLAEYRANVDMHLEHFRSIIQTAQVALRSVILINGGGAVALLAFFSRIWGVGLSAPVVLGLTKSLLLFVFGVLVAAVASGASYLTQYAYFGKWNKLGHLFRYASIVFVVISYALFAWGCYAAYGAFVAHF